MAGAEMRKKLTALQPKVRTVSLSPTRRTVATPRITGRRLIERNARLAMKRPLCVECEKLGEVRAVDEWDHKVPLGEGGAEHEDNLQGLCFEHHARKTKREEERRQGHE